jgi:uncharacterized protein involved in response to NO
MASLDAARLEVSLQKLVTAYVVTGLAFLLLPGTFLGVWNLVSISGRHSLQSMPAAWMQAHGHAQVFGWIGTFIIGIGYYSLSKMAGQSLYPAGRGWTSWILWTCGAALRWAANVTGWHWRGLLPLSAALELAAFAIFFATVSRHKRNGAPAARMEPWMKAVIAASTGFLLVLIMNLAVTSWMAWTGSGPDLPHGLDQRFLILAVWGFPVAAVWGFNARWLPVFAGLPAPLTRLLLGALLAWVAAIACGLAGRNLPSALILVGASALAAAALRVFEPAERPAKIQGVSPLFPHFARGAYVWLQIAAGLGVWAALADTQGGMWGASRHALTVGFLATMVFAIGQRVLPAFCGMRVLYSPRLMTASLILLNLGCALRVGSEIPAYEFDVALAWRVLPVSAVTELAAVSMFALNMAITLMLPPPRPAVVR